MRVPSSRNIVFGATEIHLFLIHNKYDIDCDNEIFLLPPSICVLHAPVIFIPV